MGSCPADVALISRGVRVLRDGRERAPAVGRIEVSRRTAVAAFGIEADDWFYGVDAGGWCGAGALAARRSEKALMAIEI